MARDLRRLLVEHLEVSEPIVLVGHDIGLMVAPAYAQEFRDAVSHLVVIDAPLPGTAVFDRLRSGPRVWHFALHGARDIAEMLVAGRERPYLQAFFTARSFDPSAIEGEDFDVFVDAYVEEMMREVATDVTDPHPGHRALAARGAARRPGRRRADVRRPATVSACPPTSPS